MFALNKDGWHYFNKKNNSFETCNSLQFNEKVFDRPVTFKNLLPEHTKNFLPVFSGTKILCVGRNYRKHAVELGNEVPKRPLWFLKPPSAITKAGESVIIPENVGRIDYEGEVCLIIGRECKNVSINEAQDCIGAITIGFDITARELQKSDGQWTRAKGFDTFLPLATCAAPYNDSWKKSILSVKLNNLLVQKSSLDMMVFGFEQLVSDISKCMTLYPGDLIMTGTPEGVGPIKDQDLLEITLCGACVMKFAVTCKGPVPE